MGAAQTSACCCLFPVSVLFKLLSWSHDQPSPPSLFPGWEVDAYRICALRMSFQGKKPVLSFEQGVWGRREVMGVRKGKF